MKNKEIELRRRVAEEIHALGEDWEFSNAITDCIFQNFWVYDKNKVRELKENFMLTKREHNGEKVVSLGSILKTIDEVFGEVDG